jgi:hypothetical protein
VRRCAARRPLLVCTDGVVSSLRAMRETLRDPVPTGQGGRPRRRPWCHVLIAQVGKRDERRRGVATERRIVDGTPARVETLRRRSPGGEVLNTADSEWLNATFRERLAPLARRCRALARHTRTRHEGLCLVGAVRNVQANIRTHARKLGMALPGRLLPSSVLPDDPSAKETHHHRGHETALFRIHHLFMKGGS